MWLEKQTTESSSECVANGYRLSRFFYSRFSSASSTIGAKLMSIVVRKLRAERSGFVLAKFAGMGCSGAVTVVFKNVAGGYLLNAFSIVVAVCASAFRSTNLAQCTSEAICALTVLQIQGILPRLAVHCLESTIIVLPR
jgi:hypothetical protein